MAPIAYAHGAKLSYEPSEGVEVTAQFDDGEPLSGGQVSVYAPDEPSDPWLTGTCDGRGKFFFVPDDKIPGTWQVKVRKAGHGGIINIDVKEGTVESGGSTGFSTLQIVVMSLAVIWGFVGTGLYFARRRDNARS
ncbi:MAG: carboxypeptidase regulatory-like domain-containing protein [Actinobacteria bacterium]|nr:carboxypeptidase regulatory-like domain-containing protein [Actinomycetota bacterium]